MELFQNVQLKEGREEQRERRENGREAESAGRAVVTLLAAINNYAIGDYIPILADKSFLICRGEGHKTQNC